MENTAKYRGEARAKPARGGKGRARSRGPERRKLPHLPFPSFGERAFGYRARTGKTLSCFFNSVEPFYRIKKRAVPKRI